MDRAFGGELFRKRLLDQPVRQLLLGVRDGRGLRIALGQVLASNNATPHLKPTITLSETKSKLS